MDHVQFSMADSFFMGEYRAYEDKDGVQRLGWHVTIGDRFSGKCATDLWTNQQMAAVLVLAMGVGEDNDPGYDIRTLYEVAEGAIKDLPPEVRPIP